MPDIIITYETLYEILRREKYKTELQPLDKDFFKNVLNYLKEKQEILDSQKNKETFFNFTEIQKTQTQLDNIKKILKELYERRENKIIQIALFSSRAKTKNDTSMMLPEEKSLYEHLNRVFSSHRDGILHNLLSYNFPDLIEKEKPKDIKTERKEQEKIKLVRFLYAIPKFVGDDLNIYGPFEEEDISSLPVDIANILIKKQRAEEIRT
jgi:DNA replication initiation complex subunit (GINS family)